MIRVASAAVVATACCLTCAGVSSAAASPAHSPAHRATITSQDLAVAGVGSNYYRIPALTTTNDGTILAAYDARPTLGDLPSNIKDVLRRSTDGGRTWTTQQVVRADAAPHGYGDPSFVVDHRTGRIFLFYAAGMNEGYFGSTTGNDPTDPDVLQADYSYSDDDGVTWQHRRITQDIKDPAWGGMFASSGEGIQIERGRYAGRLVQQYNVYYQGASWAMSVYSDDDGATWHHGALVGPGANENKVVELADGRLMLNVRANPYRLVSYSSDGGETWGPLTADTQLLDPNDNGSIIRYDADASPRSADAHKLLFSNNESTTSRSNLVVKESCDDGRTWPIRKVVDPGAAAYSTLTRQGHGTTGLLWESKGTMAITYTKFNDAWLDGVCAPLTVASSVSATAGSTTTISVKVTSQEQGVIQHGSMTISGLPAGWQAGTVRVPKLSRHASSAVVRVPVTIPADAAAATYQVRAQFSSTKGRSTTPTATSIVVTG